MSSETVFEATAPPPKSDRSITALLTSLVNETGLLVRQEMALFRAEINEAMGRAGRGAAALAAGGVCAFGGFLVLLAAAVLGLATVLPPWLSALIIGIVFVAIGGILLLFGKSRLKTEALTPHRTLHSLREDRIWIKEQVR
ncbi:MAG: phage holin family protein [Stellaceae bacterium]